MGRGLHAVLSLGLLLCGASAWAGPPPDGRRAEQHARLEVLLQSEPVGPGLQRHRVTGLFDASPEEVFRVATSYHRYAEYVPRITTSHALWQGGDEFVVLLEADLPWPMADSWVQARFHHDQPDEASFRVRFHMVRGNLHRYEGTLLIEPHGAGRSLVTYELLAQPDSRLPMALLQAAVGRGALNFVHCLRSRVSQLLQKGLLQGPTGAALYPLHLRLKPEEPGEDQEPAP